MERIFSNTIGGSNVTKYDEEDDYTKKVHLLMDDSVDYEEQYLGQARDTNMKYYKGIYPTLSGNDIDNREYDSYDENPEDFVPNKSSVVSTDVKDTIRTILPSLIRIFFSGQRVVDFIPRYQKQVGLATQQMKYVENVFMEDNPGFLIFHGMLKDALTTNYGVIQWWTDNDHEVQEKTFQNITVEQYQLVLYEAGDDIEVVDLQPSQDDPEIIDSVTFRYEASKPQVRVEGVPPEEFRIDRYAKNTKNSRLVGRERSVNRSFLISRGYPEEVVDEHIQNTAVSTQYTDERWLRNKGLDSDQSVDDVVVFGEWYIRCDGDGDGIDELRYITTLGPNRQLYEDYPVPRSKFALFGGDPVSHTAIGDSITDLVKDIQRIKTNVIRGLLDNLAESNNPRTVVNELLTNIEDALNDEVGAVIRTRGNVNEAVGFTRVPFIGKDSIDVISYLDNIRASRTGITEASKGLDPAAMQSTALAGVNAILEGAQEQIELIARILAETGFKDLMKGLLEEVCENPNQQRTIQVNGEWIDFDLSLFDASMGIKVNPTMGKGSDLVRMQALQMIGASQKEVIAQFVLKNPVVTPNQYLNTIQDMMEMVNIRDFDRYFTPMTPEAMKAMMEQPDEPAPEMILAQSEMEKRKVEMVTLDSKNKREDQKQLLDARKTIMDDDFRRDKLDIDTAVQLTKIGTEQANAEELAAQNKEDESHGAGE